MPSPKHKKLNSLISVYIACSMLVCVLLPVLYSPHGGGLQVLLIAVPVIIVSILVIMCCLVDCRLSQLIDFTAVGTLSLLLAMLDIIPGLVEAAFKWGDFRWLTPFLVSFTLIDIALLLGLVRAPKKISPLQLSTFCTLSLPGAFIAAPALSPLLLELVKYDTISWHYYFCIPFYAFSPLMLAYLIKLKLIAGGKEQRRTWGFIFFGASVVAAHLSFNIFGPSTAYSEPSWWNLLEPLPFLWPLIGSLCIEIFLLAELIYKPKQLLSQHLGVLLALAAISLLFTAPMFLTTLFDLTDWTQFSPSSLLTLTALEPKTFPFLFPLVAFYPILLLYLATLNISANRQRWFGNRHRPTCLDGWEDEGEIQSKQLNLNFAVSVYIGCYYIFSGLLPTLYSGALAVLFLSLFFFLTLLLIDVGMLGVIFSGPKKGNQHHLGFLRLLSLATGVLFLPLLLPFVLTPNGYDFYSRILGFLFDCSFIVLPFYVALVAFYPILLTYFVKLNISAYQRRLGAGRSE